MRSHAIVSEARRDKDSPVETPGKSGSAESIPRDSGSRVAVVPAEQTLRKAQRPEGKRKPKAGWPVFGCAKRPRSESQP